MNLTEIIINELSKSNEPDPHKIAIKLLLTINHGQTQELLIRGLTELINEQIRFARIRENEAKSPTNKVGPSRCSVAIQARVMTEDKWKMLVDCNVSDLEAIASRYSTRSQQMHEKAQYYELLSEELKCSGYATVGEMWAQQEQKAAA